MALLSFQCLYIPYLFISLTLGEMDDERLGINDQLVTGANDVSGVCNEDQIGSILPIVGEPQAAAEKYVCTCLKLY